MMSSTQKGGSVHDRDAGCFMEPSGDVVVDDEDSPPTVSIAHRSTTSVILTQTQTRTQTQNQTQTQTQTQKQAAPGVHYPQWHNALAGGIAGAGARLFTAPLDLVRIRAQLERRDVYPRPSVLGRMRGVYRAEGGFTALFRGNLAASYLWVGYTTVQFSVYGTTKDALEAIRCSRGDGLAGGEAAPVPAGLLANPSAVAFVSGAIAGVCATMVTYPFDICRTVFASRGAPATQPQQQPQKTRAARTGSAAATAIAANNATTTATTAIRPPSTIKECAVSMYRKDGLRGFYAGSAPAVVQIVPYMGLNFAIYDFLVGDGTNSKSVGLSGYAGSISGAVSKVAVYPMDTIKKRIQIQSVFGTACSQPGGVVYSGIGDCFATTVRTEGVRGLYRGLFPSVLKTTLGSGLSFAFFRTTKNLLENVHDYQH